MGLHDIPASDHLCDNDKETGKETVDDAESENEDYAIDNHHHINIELVETREDLVPVGHRNPNDSNRHKSRHKNKGDNVSQYNSNQRHDKSLDNVLLRNISNIVIHGV